jgi:hypothetical protein
MCDEQKIIKCYTCCICNLTAVGGHCINSVGYVVFIRTVWCLIVYSLWSCFGNQDICGIRVVYLCSLAFDRLQRLH